jgi:hypothetical protein
MVGSNTNNNPLDPSMLQKRNSIDTSNDKGTQTRKMSDLDSILDRNVAPYVNALSPYSPFLSSFLTQIVQRT